MIGDQHDYETQFNHQLKVGGREVGTNENHHIMTFKSQLFGTSGPPDPF